MGQFIGSRSLITFPSTPRRTNDRLHDPARLLEASQRGSKGSRPLAFLGVQTKIGAMTKKNPEIYDLEAQTIKEIVLERLEELGLTIYQLATYAGLECAPSTLYRYLKSGDSKSFSGNLEQLLAKLGISLVVTEPTPEWVEES